MREGHTLQAACANKTGLPVVILNVAVVDALALVFSPAALREHFRNQAGNVAAREHRAAERAHLLATIPTLAAAETKLVRRIGLVDDDALAAGAEDRMASSEGRTGNR